MGVQNSCFLSVQQRVNFDLIFVAHENMISNQKRLYEHYFGTFPSFKQFLNCLNKNTEKYQFITIDNSRNNTSFSEIINTYKICNVDKPTSFLKLIYLDETQLIDFVDLEKMIDETEENKKEKIQKKIKQNDILITKLLKHNEKLSKLL